MLIKVGGCYIVLATLLRIDLLLGLILGLGFDDLLSFYLVDLFRSDVVP